MEGTYSRRTLGYLNRKRMDSVEKPITPSDELSSWLGDDVCAHCSRPAKGGQLYCSKECRQQDEQDYGGAAGSTAAAGGLQSEESLTRAPSPTSDQDGGKQQQIHNRPSSSSSLEDRSFRYPCPPSPNLLAQYQASTSSNHTTTTTTTSALTSPALTAFQRSLPQQSSRGRSLQFSNAASSEQSYSQPQRRSSSQSTFSSNSASASDNAYTTDPSTTSPNGGGAVSDEDLEPSDLNLPPSAATASLVLLKSNGGTLRSTSTASSNSPAALPQGITSNSNPTSSTPASTSGSTSIRSPASTFNANGSSIKYTRRPSSTNLQPPVLYSPALTPTTSKIHAVRVQATSSSSSNSTSKSMASRSYDAERKLRMGGISGGGERRLLKEMRRHSDDATDGKENTVKALDVENSVSGFDKRSSLMVRSQTDKTDERSPPLSSVASSTTKTVHALSPRGTTQAVCGRFGCRGSSTRRESIGELASSLRSNSNKVSRRGSSPISSSGSGSSKSPSPSSSRASRPTRHQHTHSATAGLGELPRLTASAIKALTMTPALNARRTSTATPLSPKTAQRRGRSPARRPSHGSGNGMEISEDAAAAIERGTPPRGRSKARGPRSTSRRSESPSRVLSTAHRLRSGSPRAGGKVSTTEETLQQAQEKVQRSDSEISNPPSPLSPKSHPISITRSGRLGPLSSGRIRAQEGDGAVADDEKDLSGISPLALRAHKSTGRSSSRGRRNNNTSGDESRERGRGSKVRSTATSLERARGKSRDQLGNSQELTRVENRKEIGKAQVDIDPGFDDVDDIEL